MVSVKNIIIRWRSAIHIESMTKCSKINCNISILVFYWKKKLKIQYTNLGKIIFTDNKTTKGFIAIHFFLFFYSIFQSIL